MSTLKLSKRDIRFMDIIYKSGNILAIAPSYNFETDTITCPLLNKIYGTLLLSLLLILTSYSTQNGKHQYLYDLHKASTIFIVELINSFFLAMELILIILSSCLFNQESWSKLNKNLQRVDAKLNNRNRKENSLSANVHFQFCVHFCVLFMLDFYICRTAFSRFSDLAYSPSFWLHQMCYLCEYFMCFLIYNLSVALKYRYEDLNKLLESENCPKPGTRVAEIRNLLILLYESVTSFNRIFGWPLVFFIGRGMLQLLQSLQLAMFTLNRTISVKGDVEAQGFAVTNLIIFGSVSFEMILVIMSCDWASSESKRTTLLCYKLQARFAEGSSERRELMRLANETTTTSARFTAADFFDINRKLFFGILSATTTYFIICVQFNM